MKQRIVVIHGGVTFETYEEYLADLKSSELTLEKINRIDWKDKLKEELPEFEVVYPKMPNAKNARYEEWKIWFEKIIKLLEDEVILIGHSLGAIFLVKYLAENDCLKKITAVYLIAPPYDDKDCEESLADFALGDDLGNFARQTPEIILYHSQDDPVVPFVDAGKYQKAIPKLILKTFTDRGHFNQPDLSELVADLKSRLV